MFLENLRDEIDATLARDPAARSRLEVALCYPGFHALMYHRLAHWLWRRGWFLAGRFVSYLGRVQTGIEIHPGAKIGKRVFIDHGMGVVIGETAEVGDDCTIYQGVTLGGTKLTRGAKRHPTIGNDVIVSAHAQVLGPFRVGDCARIGPLALVQAEVPDGARMVGMRARPLGARPAEPVSEPVFQPYGIGEDIPDPVARALNGLLDEVTSLRARVAELERARSDTATAAVDRPEPIHGNGADDAERLS
jgi:serine O-acetyltransferase